LSVVEAKSLGDLLYSQDFHPSQKLNRDELQEQVTKNFLQLLTLPASPVHLRIFSWSV
jgi:hypothetical protein